MHNPTADLDTALSFVIDRIEDEATRSGEPLDDEERFFLRHLPANSVIPQSIDPEIPNFILRDFQYEKLCELAKAAYSRDLKTNPGSAVIWKFAYATSQLNRHPMSWLLHWAGVKERRPWWDRWLLAGAGLLFVVIELLVMALGEYLGESWTRMKWTVVGGGCTALLVLFYFISRRVEDRLWKQTVERYRRESPSSTDGKAG